MEAGGDATWGESVTRGWSPTADATEKPDTESDEAFGELSDAGSGSTAAPEREGADKGSSNIDGGPAFMAPFSPAGATAAYSPQDCAQLTPACRSLLNDLQHRTEDVNAALDSVIRLLLHQQQRHSSLPVILRPQRRGTAAAEAEDGRKQQQHLRSRSGWDSEARDCAASLPGSSFSSPAWACGSSDAVAATRRSASAAPAAACAGSGGDQATAAAEDEDTFCYCCGRPFNWNGLQQVKHELERVQQMRLRERARADMQAIKHHMELQKLQQRNQQLEETISQRDDALRTAQAHIRALQQQLAERRQLPRIANAPQRARTDLVPTLTLSSTTGSSRQQRPEVGTEQQDDEGVSVRPERGKLSSASVHLRLRDLARVSRRLADHALPADSASPPVIQQKRQQSQHQQTQKHEVRAWQDQKELRSAVTLEHAGEPPSCLSAATLYAKRQRGTSAKEPTPADVLEEEFRLNIQTLRNSRARGNRLPAMKEWMELFFAAWRILQSRMKSVVVPERPTEKSLQLVKEKLEEEKLLIFKSLTQLQQESLRVMKQVFHTPWRVLELETDKKNLEVCLSELREELWQAQTKSTELSVSLGACKQSLAAAERERDRLLAVSELCAFDVETRFEQLQEKRHLLQESQAAHAQAEAAAAASERELKTQQKQLREHQQLLLQKHQQLLQKQGEFDEELQQHLATKHSAKTAHQALHAKAEECESLRMEIESLLAEKEKLADALWETHEQLAATAGALQAQESSQQQKHQELLHQCAQLQQELLQSIKHRPLPAALRIRTPPLGLRMRERHTQKYALRRLRRYRAGRRRAAGDNLPAEPRSSSDGTSAEFVAVAAAPTTDAASLSGDAAGATWVGDYEEKRRRSSGSARWLSELRDYFFVPAPLHQQQQQQLFWMEETGALEQLEQSWNSVLQSLPRVEKQLRCVYATVAAASRHGTGRGELYAADIKEIEGILGHTCSRAAQLRSVLQAVGLPASAGASLAEPHQQAAQQDHQQLNQLQPVAEISRRSQKKPQHQQTKNEFAAAGTTWANNGTQAQKEDEVWEFHEAFVAGDSTAAKINGVGNAVTTSKAFVFDEPEIESERMGKTELGDCGPNAYFAEELLPALAMQAHLPKGADGRLRLTARDGPEGSVDRRRGIRTRRNEEVKDRKERGRAAEEAHSEESSSRHARHRDVEVTQLLPSANRIYLREEATCGAYSPLFLQQTSSDCQHNSRRNHSSGNQNRSSTNSRSYRDGCRSSGSSSSRRTHERSRGTPSGRGKGEGRGRNSTSREARPGTPSRRGGSIKCGELSSLRRSLQVHSSSILCLSSSSSSNSTLQDLRVTSSSSLNGSDTKVACRAGGHRGRLSVRSSRGMHVYCSTSSANAGGSGSSNRRADLGRFSSLRKARPRQLLSEGAQHRTSNRSVRGEHARQSRYYSEQRGSFNNRSNCNSGEEERGALSRSAPSVTASSQNSSYETLRSVSLAAARQFTGPRQPRGLRRSSSTSSLSVSSCSGHGSATPLGRLHRVKREPPADFEKQKTMEQDAPRLVAWESAGLKQQPHALVRNTGREEYVGAEGVPCASQRRKKKKLLLLHAFYASHRPRSVTQCKTSRQPEQQEHRQQKQQEQHSERRQQQRCEQGTQLEQHMQWHRRSDKHPEVCVLQGAGNRQFSSVPSVACALAVGKQDKDYAESVVEADPEDKDDDSQQYERCSGAAPAADFPKKQQHEVPLDALHKVEAELQQANKVVRQIESTLLLPADFFKKMRALTQQNFSLNSRLCLLRTEYQRLKREKEELEIQRVAEIDYIKFQEEMQQRIQQLERQLRSGAAESSTQRETKEAFYGHGQLGEKSQVESMQIQHALEIRTIKDLSALEVERMRQTHERELSQLQQALRAAQDDMRAELKQRLHVAQLQQEAAVEQLRCTWETKLQETKQQHEQHLLQQKRMQAEALHRAEMAHETALKEEKKAFAKKLQQTEKHWESRLLDQEVQIVKERDTLIARFRERLSRLEEELEQQRSEAARLSELLQQQKLHGDRSEAELQRQLREAVLENSELQAEINRQTDKMDEMHRQLSSSLKKQDGPAVSASFRQRGPSLPQRLQADRSCQVCPPMRSRGTQVEATTLEYIRECAEIAAEAAAAVSEEHRSRNRGSATVAETAADAATWGGARAIVQEVTAGDEAAAATIQEDAGFEEGASAAHTLQYGYAAVGHSRERPYAAAAAGARRPRVEAARAHKETTTMHDRGLAFFGGDTSEKRMQLRHQRKEDSKSTGVNFLQEQQQQGRPLAARGKGGWTHQRAASAQPKRFIEEAHFLRARSHSSVSDTGEARVDTGHAIGTLVEGEKAEEQSDSVGPTSCLLRSSHAVRRSQETDGGAAEKFKSSSATNRAVETVSITPFPTRKMRSARGDTSSVPSRLGAIGESYSGGGASGAAWYEGASGLEYVASVRSSESVEHALAIGAATAARPDAPEDASAVGRLVEESTAVRRPSKGNSMWTRGREIGREAKESIWDRIKGDGHAQGGTKEERREDGEQTTVIHESEGSSLAAEEKETRATELFRRLADDSSRNNAPRLKSSSGSIHHDTPQAAAAAAVVASSSNLTATGQDAATFGWDAATMVAAEPGAASEGLKDAAAAAVALEQETPWKRRPTTNSNRAAAYDMPAGGQADSGRRAGCTRETTGSSRCGKSNNSRTLQQQHKKTKCFAGGTTAQSNEPTAEHFQLPEKSLPKSVLPHSMGFPFPDKARAADCTDAVQYGFLPAPLGTGKKAGARNRDQQNYHLSSAHGVRPAAAATKVEGQASVTLVAERQTPARANGGDSPPVAARGDAVGPVPSTAASLPAAASVFPQLRRQPHERTFEAFSSCSANEIPGPKLPVKEGEEEKNQMPITYAFESCAANAKSKFDGVSVIATKGNASRSGDVSSRFSSGSTRQESLLEEQSTSVYLGTGMVVGLSSSLDAQLRKLHARCKSSTCAARAQRPRHQEAVAAPEQPPVAAADRREAAGAVVAGRRATIAAAPTGRRDDEATAGGVAAAAAAAASDAGVKVFERSEGRQRVAALGTVAASSDERRSDGSWRDLPTWHAQRSLHVRLVKSGLAQTARLLCTSARGDTFTQKDFCAQHTQQQLRCSSGRQQSSDNHCNLKASWGKHDVSVTLENLMQEDEREVDALAQLLRAIRRRNATRSGAC